MQRHNPNVGVILEQWTPIRDTVANSIDEQERWADTGVAFLKSALAGLKPEHSGQRGTS